MMRLCASTSILPGARIFGRHQYSPLWRHLAPSLDQSALYLKLRIFRIYQHFFGCVKKKHEMNFLILYSIKFIIIDKSFGCEKQPPDSSPPSFERGDILYRGEIKTICPVVH